MNYSTEDFDRKIEEAVKETPDPRHGRTLETRGCGRSKDRGLINAQHSGYKFQQMIFEIFFLIIPRK